MNRHPIGTGPVPLRRAHADRVVLARFDGHFAGPPKLDRIVFEVVPDATVRALELLKGSVQLVVNDLPPDLVPRFRARPALPGGREARGQLRLPRLQPRGPGAARRARAPRARARRSTASGWCARSGAGSAAVTETMMPPGHWARHDGAAAACPTIPRRRGGCSTRPATPTPTATARRRASRSPTRPRPTSPTCCRRRRSRRCSPRSASTLEHPLLRVRHLLRRRAQGELPDLRLLRTGVVDPDFYRLVLHSRELPPAGQNRGRYLNAGFDRLIDQGGRLTDPAARRPYYLAPRRSSPATSRTSASTSGPTSPSCPPS